LFTCVVNTGIDTPEQFIAGVVDTADKHSFAIIPNGILRGPGDTDS
jgi:hypothetical protein